MKNPERYDLTVELSPAPTGAWNVSAKAPIVPTAPVNAGKGMRMAVSPDRLSIKLSNLTEAQQFLTMQLLRGVKPIFRPKEAALQKIQHRIVKNIGGIV